MKHARAFLSAFFKLFVMSVKPKKKKVKVASYTSKSLSDFGLGTHSKSAINSESLSKDGRRITTKTIPGPSLSPAKQKTNPLPSSLPPDFTDGIHPSNHLTFDFCKFYIDGKRQVQKMKKVKKLFRKRKRYASSVRSLTVLPLIEMLIFYRTSPWRFGPLEGMRSWLRWWEPRASVLSMSVNVQNAREKSLHCIGVRTV